MFRDAPFRSGRWVALVLRGHIGVHGGRVKHNASRKRHSIIIPTKDSRALRCGKRWPESRLNLLGYAAGIAEEHAGNHQSYGQGAQPIHTGRSSHDRCASSF